ncbi:MAG: hypothetical protein ACLVML_06360 [Candidatus Gastranaerophilaceae bacterium]
MQNDNVLVNCMGYALDIDQYLNDSQIKLLVSEIKEKTMSQISSIVLSKVESWMQSNLGSRAWGIISAYNSDIGLNQYRMVIRSGFEDSRAVYELEDGPYTREVDGKWDRYFTNGN